VVQKKTAQRLMHCHFATIWTTLSTLK